MNDKKVLGILRIMLLASAFGWGVSAFAIFLPWDVIVDQLIGLGAREIPNDPMLNYWLRMAATVFTFIGILFLMLAVKPVKFMIMLPFAGVFMLAEGLVLLVYGVILHLDPLPFYVDTAFCLLLGIGILLGQQRLKKQAMTTC